LKSAAARWSTGGWKIIAVAVPILVAIPVAITGSAGVRDDSVLLAVRASAVAGFLIFIAPFSASAALALLPSAPTRYVRGRRRYFGIVFAFAMLVHIVCVAWLFQVNPNQSVNEPMFMLGAFGYVFIVALFATSFDRTTDWLGPERWRWLHLTGIWYVWGYFVLIMIRAFPSTPTLYGTLLVLAFITAGLRCARRSKLWLQPIPSTR
jgi:methionine sulfoxide reductase heme-binding subunit